MFAIFGTETRRLPRPSPSRVPWNKIPIAALILTVAVVAILMVVSSGSSTPFTGVEVQEQPVVEPAVSMVQEEPETIAVVPVAKEWPKVQVVWSEPFLVRSLADLPSSLPPGKGFYNDPSRDASSAGSSDEAFAFTQKILGISTPSNITPVIAGVARDPVNPNLVFAAVSVNYKDPGPVRFFLSVDGEKTWKEVSIIYPDRPLTGGYFDVRVERKGDDVILYTRDPAFVAEMWRKATLSLKGLP